MWTKPPAPVRSSQPADDLPELKEIKVELRRSCSLSGGGQGSADGAALVNDGPQFNQGPGITSCAGRFWLGGFGFRLGCCASKIGS